MSHTALPPPTPAQSLSLLSHRVTSHGKLIRLGGFQLKALLSQCSGFNAKYLSLEQLCAILLVMRHICNCFAFIIVGMVGHANYVCVGVSTIPEPRHHICIQYKVLGSGSGSDEYHVCSLITPSYFLMNNYSQLPLSRFLLNKDLVGNINILFVPTSRILLSFDHIWWQGRCE